MNTLFFVLALVSMVSFGIQTSLLAHFSRTIDGMSTAFYRNMSLVVSLSPLLLFVAPDAWARLPEVLPILFFAGFCGGFSLSGFYESARHLPIGIQGVFRSVGRVLLMIPLGWYFFGETLEGSQLMSIGLILLGGAGISLHSNDFEHLQDGCTKKGMWLMAMSCVFGTISVFSMSVAVRKLDPFLAGYLWEVFVGIMIGILIFLRSKLTPYRMGRLPLYGKSGFLALAAISSLAFFRTGAFVVATDIGPVALLSAIASGSVFVATFIGWAFFHEKLHKNDLLWITVSIIGIVSLKVL